MASDEDEHNDKDDEDDEHDDKDDEEEAMEIGEDTMPRFPLSLEGMGLTTAVGGFVMVRSSFFQTNDENTKHNAQHTNAATLSAWKLVDPK